VDTNIVYPTSQVLYRTYLQAVHTTYRKWQLIDLSRDLKSLEKFIAEKLGNEIPEEKTKVKTCSSNRNRVSGTGTVPKPYPVNSKYGS
jgi:hypothetical protein